MEGWRDGGMEERGYGEGCVKGRGRKEIGKIACLDQYERTRSTLRFFCFRAASSPLSLLLVVLLLPLEEEEEEEEEDDEDESLGGGWGGWVSRLRSSNYNE